MATKFLDRHQANLWLWIYLAFFLNTLIFVVLVSDPLLTQDSWYFLDAFVRHAYDGTLSVGDFFVQRTGLDHAQPLRKLVLLIEVKWFRLSLLPQAIIGLFCAGLCAYLLHKLVQQDADDRGNRLDAGLMWLVMGCVLISLNSTGVWTWSLVALGYSSLIIVFWFFISVWRALETGRLAEVIVSAVLLATVSDDTALLAGAAALLATVGYGCKKNLRRKWWSVPVVFVILIGVVQILLDVFGPVVGVGDIQKMGVGGFFRLLLHGEGWWQWPTYALSNSVASMDVLLWLDPAHVVQWQILLAAILVCLHLWFWAGFLRARATGTTFVAVCLMLLFYASVAGIVYGRVGEFGSNYLNEPRYVLLYQLNLVALALMYVGVRRTRDKSPPKVWHRLRLGTGFAFVFLVFQVVLAKHAWHTAPYIRFYYWQMAEQTIAMAKNPDITPPNCVPELPICGMPPGKRAELLGLLQQHNLNVFNDKFRAMHGFRPVLR